MVSVQYDAELGRILSERMIEVATQQSPPAPIPNACHIHIERMVNGYIVQVSEGFPSGHSIKGARYLVVSQQGLSELLGSLAPKMLDSPAISPFGDDPIEEKVW